MTKEVKNKVQYLINHKGQPCVIHAVNLCQEGYCNECQLYRDWVDLIPETINVTINLQIDTEAWRNFRDKGMPDSEIRAELRRELLRQVGKESRLIADVNDIETTEVK
jgi:hypothetical protein